MSLCMPSYNLLASRGSVGKRLKNMCSMPQQKQCCWPVQQCARQQLRRQPFRLQATGLGDEDLDIAVFRFTLGIPGFDDSNIPRVVGAVVAALVVVNHFLGAQPAPPAQVRAEFLDITLAVLCFTAPEVEARLRQVVPGRGRAGAAQVAGAQQIFALAEGQPDSFKKELAWASFALLKNVNCCSVLLLQPAANKVLMARGAVAESVAVAGDSAASISKIEQSLRSSSALQALSSQQQQQWSADRLALKAAGLSNLGFIASGVESALVQPLAGDSGSVLLVLGDRARALSDKDRNWVAAVARKLEAVL